MAITIDNPNAATVNVSSTDPTRQARITFTSADVGNGDPLDGNNSANEDGGLAVHLQAEDATDGLEGAESRHGDEAIRFNAVTAGLTFDVRDLATGLSHGDQFRTVILGVAGSESLAGTAEIDYIEGGQGNDTLNGGAGGDVLVGGAGNDTYEAVDADDTVIEAAEGGFDTVRTALASYTLGDHVERLILSGVGANPGQTGIGNAENNILLGNFRGETLRGMGGNDILNGGSGNDILDGGEGVDTVSFQGASVRVTVDLAISGPQLTIVNSGFGSDFPNDFDTLISIENLIGGSGNDEFFGNDGDNVLYGQGGADRLHGRAGDDTLFGELGDDFLSGGEGSDGLSGGDGADYLGGGAGDDGLFGDAGNDRLAGGDGADLLDGGSGDDQLDGGADADLLAGFDGADTLLGDAGDDLLLGELGNDTLTGGAGDDTLDGGDGRDIAVFSGARSSYSIVYDEIAGINTVTDLREGSPDGTDFLINVEGAQFSNVSVTLAPAPPPPPITGTESSDFLNGTRFSEEIDGLGGNDVITGGQGDDIIDGGSGSDVAMYSGASSDYSIVYDEVAGTNTITDLRPDSPDGVDVLTGVEAARFSDMSVTLAPASPPPPILGNVFGNSLNGTSFSEEMYGLAGNDRLMGEQGNDILFGGEGNDTLDGGRGADILRGGLGNDIYIFLDGVDTIVEELNEGLDTVQTYAASTTLAANVESLVLINSAREGTGNELANVITGNISNNRLDGGAGKDTLTGGLGDDTYVVDQVGDRVVELARQGTDTVEAAFSYTLGSTLENLTLSGLGAINGTGNTVNNVLTGNGAANALLGLLGADTLNGAGGNDILDGGLGIDVLTGGDGEDAFRFTAKLNMANADIVKDFTLGEDVLVLENKIFKKLVVGDLNPAAFVDGAVATAATAQILYDSATGALSFDGDGTGIKAAIQFASVDAGTSLTASDFEVI